MDGGEYVGANQRLMSVSMADSFIIECDISMDNNFITAGDICELGNATHSLEGVVTGVKPGEQTKKVTVLIRSDEVTAGETFDIYFEKESGERYTLVPNGAINRDGDGYFLKRVQKRDGILGEEFYTDEVRVRIGDSDSTNTVISEGMDFFEPVALFGDKPFKADEAIKLRNESDFFEK